MRGALIPLTRSQISAASKHRFAFLGLLREGGWPSLAEGVEIHALPMLRVFTVGLVGCAHGYASARVTTGLAFCHQ